LVVVVVVVVVTRRGRIAVAVLIDAWGCCWQWGLTHRCAIPSDTYQRANGTAVGDVSMSCTRRSSSDLSAKEKAVYAFLVLAAIWSCMSVLFAIIAYGEDDDATKEADALGTVAAFHCSLPFIGTSIAIGVMVAQKRELDDVVVGDCFNYTITACALALFSLVLLAWLRERRSAASSKPSVRSPAATTPSHCDTSIVVGSPPLSTTVASPQPYSYSVSSHGGKNGAQSPRPSSVAVMSTTASTGQASSAFIPLASSTRIQGGTAADGTAVIAGQQSTIGVGMSANIINLILAVDCSGSMAGSRWRSVQQGVAEAIGQLSDVDVVTIIPFNNTVQAIGPAPKCRFPLHAFAALSPGGNTMLYDATVLALITALELHRAVDQATHLTRTTYVVVMTDGEDNGSRTNLEVIKELLLQINRFRDFEVRCRCSNTGASLAPPSH
jgi:Mg-chelatase subunit ChlD